MSNFFKKLRLVRQINEKKRRERDLREIKHRIVLKIDEVGNILMVVRTPSGETAIRKFEDKETVKDIRNAVTEVVVVATHNYTADSI